MHIPNIFHIYDFVMFAVMILDCDSSEAVFISEEGHHCDQGVKNDDRTRNIWVQVLTHIT